MSETRQVLGDGPMTIERYPASEPAGERYLCTKDARCARRAEWVERDTGHGWCLEHPPWVAETKLASGGPIGPVGPALEFCGAARRLASPPPTLLELCLLPPGHAGDHAREEIRPVGSRISVHVHLSGLGPTEALKAIARALSEAVQA